MYKRVENIKDEIGFCSKHNTTSNSVITANLKVLCLESEKKKVSASFFKVKNYVQFRR